MTPCWIELSSPNVDESKAFYSAIFGWEFTAPGPLGIGETARVDGKAVAGISEQPDQAPEGQPGFWSLYFRVGDFDQFMESVASHGGQALMAIPNFDGDASVALVADSYHTGFGVLSFHDGRGLEAFRMPGASTWFELNAKDLAVTEFYTSVFGWVTATDADGYTTFATDADGGDPFGGIVDISGVEIPQHWKIYFQVDSIDDTLRHAKEHGGAVLTEPVDTPLGTVAQIIDCHNAAAALLQPR